MYTITLDGHVLEAETAESLQVGMAGLLANGSSNGSSASVSPPSPPSPGEATSNGATSDRARCIGKAASGANCRSPIVMGNGYCRAHQPDKPTPTKPATRKATKVATVKAWIKANHTGSQQIRPNMVRSRRKPLNRALYHYEYRAMTKVTRKGKVWFQFRPCSKTVNGVTRKSRVKLASYDVCWETGEIKGF